MISLKILTSIIITCSNRLDHLKQSITALNHQSNSEIIIVDYNCSQGTAKFVRKNYPTFQVIEVKNANKFNVAKARNIGAKHARGDLLFFCDADILLMENIGFWLQKNFKNDFFYISSKEDETFGSSMIRKKDFIKINGYDEAFDGWGGEDRDLYERLKYSGIKQLNYPENFLRAIPHADSLRQLGHEHGAMNSKREQLKLNNLYREIKMDIMRIQGRDLTLKNRIEIMTKIKHLFQSSNLKALSINLTSRNPKMQYLKKTLKYENFN